MNRPVCRRCLLNELDGEYFKSIYQYIANLPEEEKAGPQSYRRRLDLCRGCADLQNGLCAQCGCFVEVRAAKRHMGCPAGKWNKEEDVS